MELGVPEVVRQLEPEVRVENYDGLDRFLILTESAPTRSQAFLHTGWARRAAARWGSSVPPSAPQAPR